MPSSDRPEFVRRPNRDGSSDSICKRCLATLATSKEEAELERAERDHLCQTENLERWKNLSEGKIRRHR